MDGRLAVCPDGLWLLPVRNIGRRTEALEDQRVVVEGEGERMAHAYIVEGSWLPVKPQIPIAERWRLLDGDASHRPRRRILGGRNRSNIAHALCEILPQHIYVPV